MFLVPRSREGLRDLSFISLLLLYSLTIHSLLPVFCRLLNTFFVTILLWEEEEVSVRNRHLGSQRLKDLSLNSLVTLYSLLYNYLLSKFYRICEFEYLLYDYSALGRRIDR